MCMDKGYDYPEVYELLEDYGYTIHIPLRGEHRLIVIYCSTDITLMLSVIALFWLYCVYMVVASEYVDNLIEKFSEIKTVLKKGNTKSKGFSKFRKEYNLKYLGHVGNVFGPADIDGSGDTIQYRRG